MFCSKSEQKAESLKFPLENRTQKILLEIWHWGFSCYLNSGIPWRCWRKQALLPWGRKISLHLDKRLRRLRQPESSPTIINLWHRPGKFSFYLHSKVVPEYKVFWTQEIPEQAVLGPHKYSTGKVSGKWDTLRISFYVIHLSDPSLLSPF